MERSEYARLETTHQGEGERAIGVPQPELDQPGPHPGWPPAPPDRDAAGYGWRVLSVTSLGVTLTGLNTSTLDVALPAVARHFRASPTEATWLLLGYMLVNTVLILVFGRLADLIGRRQLYIAGLALFTVSSLACGLAPSATVLIGLRVVQAVGAAAIITNTTALLTDAFPSRLLGLALGLNITIISAAQVAGPIVGGAMATGFGWRAVFWFNVPFGVAGVLWAMVTLRRVGSGGARERFDLLGAVLAALLLGGLVLALSEGGPAGWTSPLVLAGAAVAVLSLPAFLAVQLRRRDPLLDLRLFADRERAMAYVAVFLMAVARFSVVLLVSLFVQAAQGLTAFQAGLRVFPVAAGMMIVSPLAGQLAGRFPARVVSTVGLSIATLGLLLLARVIDPRMPYPPLFAGLLAVGVGSGLFMTPNTSAIMSSVSAERRGIANGFRSMLQNTGFVVSTALTLAIVTTGLTGPEQRAAYDGTLARLPGGDLAHFVEGARVALVVMAVMSLLGLLASLLRGRPSAAGHGQGSPLSVAHARKGA